VFFNILENSVRFQNRPNGLEKKISVRAEKRNRGASISFVDNGIGIPTENVPFIFQMFSKAALEHHTIGLGLYTARQCLNKLRGSISLVQSTEYQTEFEVVI
jgi:signal transduction histidine kinase